MKKIIKMYEVTTEDTEKIRQLMKENNIKGTVRKGTGSCRYWVYIRTEDDAIVDLIKPLGFRLLFRPKAWDKRYTFEKSTVKIIHVMLTAKTRRMEEGGS